MITDLLLAMLGLYGSPAPTWRQVQRRVQRYNRKHGGAYFGALRARARRHGAP